MENEKYHRPTNNGWLNTHGYREICVDGVPIKEHRYVMEQHLGRKLETYEHIHHINGVITDNSITNLKLVSPSEHTIIHHYEGPLVLNCEVCGVAFEQKRRGRNIRTTCSKECQFSLIGKKVSAIRKTKYWISRGKKRHVA